MPHVGDSASAKSEDEGGGGGGGGGNGGGGGGGNIPPGLDVVIAALIQKLPTEGKFDPSARVRWLRQIEMAFQDAYGADDGGAEISITLKKSDA